MFDAISGDAIRLKSRLAEAIPSVLLTKWLVTRARVRAQSGLYRFACAWLVMASGLILGRLERA